MQLILKHYTEYVANNLLDYSISKASNDDQHSSQRSFHSRKHLCKHYCTLNCTHKLMHYNEYIHHSNLIKDLHSPLFGFMKNDGPQNPTIHQNSFHADLSLIYTITIKYNSKLLQLNSLHNVQRHVKYDLF